MYNITARRMTSGELLKITERIVHHRRLRDLTSRLKTDLL